MTDVGIHSQMNTTLLLLVLTLSNAVIEPVQKGKLATRTQNAFRPSTELLKRLKAEACKQNRSLNNFVESVLMVAVYRTPNAVTMAAVIEAREGKNLETINMDNLERIIESLQSGMFGK